MSTEENKTEQNKASSKPEKLRSIMEAASALTALGDEDEENGETSLVVPAATADKKKNKTVKGDDVKGDDIKSKRFLPEHKKPDAAPTFPEKMMKMMIYADKQPSDFCVAWLEDGKSFVIRNPDEFTRKVVPKFFKATKFSSFTRKLYRWGFRQINRGIGPDDPVIFGNEYFQRDQMELMSKMRSVTAAGTRKAEQESNIVFLGMKRAGGDQLQDANRKRLLLDHIFQQKAQPGIMNHTSSIYGNLNQTNQIPLTNALRTGMNYSPSQQNMMAMNQHLMDDSITQLGAMNSPMISMQSFKQFDVAPQPIQQGVGNMMNSYAGQQQNTMNGAQYQNSQSTQDILNAAIAALRYA